MVSLSEDNISVYARPVFKDLLTEVPWKLLVADFNDFAICKGILSVHREVSQIFIPVYP